MALPWIAEALRLYVAMVLAVAVAGKLRAPAAFVLGVEELFHLRGRMARWAAGVVAGAEALAVGLLTVGGVWGAAGAALALALFVVFGTVIAIVLAERRAVACSCFGERDGRLLSGVDLARNGTLATASLVALTAPPGGILQLAVGGAGLSVAGGLALATVMLPRLWPRRGAALAAGAGLPAFAGVAEIDGQPVTNADLAARPAAFVFLSTGCPTCREQVPALLRRLPEFRDVALWIVPMESGPSPLLAGNALAARELRLTPQMRQQLNPAGLAPHYVLVDASGRVQAVGRPGDAAWEAFARRLAVASAA